MAPSPAFVLLGPLQMSVDGSVVSVGTPKQRAVLAALVINRNRAVASDALVNAVWGEDPPSEARSSLHAYISNLRRLLRSAGADGRQLLEKASPGYRFNVDDSNVDLGRFTLERGKGLEAATAGRFEDASRHFSAALYEWQGEFLEDLRGFQFVETFATALVEDKISVHTVRAQAEIACGRADSVIGELEELVSDQPFREPVWAQLMTAYYLAQRQSDALDAYQRLKTVLADELGIDPDPAVRELHDVILRQKPLNIARSAKTTAAETMVATSHQYAFASSLRTARLRGDDGQSYPVVGPVTRIGRQPDNQIVLADPKVSRRHAVIIDTGTGYVINDAGSANGIMLRDSRIEGSAVLVGGDRIVIGDREFVFEVDSTQEPQTDG